MRDDAELMRGAGAGDAQAFRELVERHERAAYNFFLRLVRNPHDAEDLVQELFLAIWKSAARYRPEAPFRAYLFRIASNLATSHLRRSSYRGAASVDELEESGRETATSRPEDDPARTYEMSELRRRYEAALGRLPAEWRIALELRVGREMSYQEIARAMGKSVPAVESILVRARERLAAELGGRQAANDA